MAIEKLTEALEEVKRVDHLIYVSLKYTRTVDVIINVLGRMVDAYSLLMDSLIAKATTEGKVISEPESAIERADLVRSIYSQDTLIVDNVDLYLLLRKLLRARNVERENEYRRHVTMKTIIEGREEIVNIDIITNYYLFEREFLAHVRAIIEGHTAVNLQDQDMNGSKPPAWGDAHDEIDDEPEEEYLPKSAGATAHPPVRQPLKVRPVHAPPRKRAPRPKKYKIQIPKGPNPILRAPFQYDPKYNRELRLAQEKEAAGKVKAAAKAAAKTARPKGVAKKKPAAKAKAPKRSAPKKAAKKKR